MSPPTPLQEWLREAGEGSLLTARRHVAAETTADTDLICGTVSRDVFFAVPRRTRDGNEIPPGTILTSYDEVRDYYAKRADAYVVVDSKHLRSIAGDWYVFNESAASLRGTGTIGDADASGAEFMVNSAVLFPTAEDGIRGEICVTRHPFEDVVNNVLSPLPNLGGTFPVCEMNHSTLLDRFVDALRTHETAKVGALLSATHTLALRLDALDGTPVVETATTRADAQKILSTLFQQAADIAVVSRIVTDWYVFAEYAALLDAGRVRRFAAIHPIEDGELTGTFGYGRDEQESI